MKVQLTLRNKLTVVLFLVFGFYVMFHPARLSAGEVESTTGSYTQKDLDGDLKLSIEQLREKYPINWWEGKFGSIELVNTGGCDTDEGTFAEDNNIECHPEEHLSELTKEQIKSIFVHINELAYNADKSIEDIMRDISINGTSSQYYYLKNFIFYKEVLPNVERLSCEMVKYTPEDLEYYREMILKRVNKIGSIIKCLPDYLKDDEEVSYTVIYNKQEWRRKNYMNLFSLRIQEIYYKEGIDGLKSRIKTKEGSNI